MKLGKQPPRFDSRTLQFGSYLTKDLPSPPQSVNYYQAVKTWPMMGNDSYGDCTCAAAGHMIEDWTANTGKEQTLSDSQILAAYNYFAQGNADAGANMLDVLNYWRKTGIGGDHIASYAQLEPHNVIQCKDAVSLFGACYLGLALPDFAVREGADFLKIPWVVPPKGPRGDAAPNPNNGHCVPAVGYDDRNVYVVTWGALKSMSWQFYQTYTDEAFAVLSPDWISRKLGGKCPAGFDMATLESDLTSIKAQAARA